MAGYRLLSAAEVERNISPMGELSIPERQARPLAGLPPELQREAWAGWTQQAIGELLGVEQKTVSLDIQNSHLGKLYNDLGPHWNDKGIAAVANRLNLSLTDACACARVGWGNRRPLGGG